MGAILSPLLKERSKRHLGYYAVFIQSAGDVYGEGVMTRDDVVSRSFRANNMYVVYSERVGETVVPKTS